MAKAALVTGSNSGIGWGIAREMARAGYDIALNSFTDRPQDHAMAMQISDEFGVRALYLAADMADANACRALVSETHQAFGRLDVLVNNAGIQHVAPVDEFPIDRWNAIIAINLNSVFHTSAVAIPIMKAAGQGRIVNIASAHGLRASPGKSAYVAAKHGVVGFTKTVALELARDNITCNAICPGFVLTPLVQKQIDDLAAQHPDLSQDEIAERFILAKQPSKQFATIEQIGGTTVFLCSDAAAQINGTTISVDGGWTAQ